MKRIGFCVTTLLLLLLLPLQVVIGGCPHLRANRHLQSGGGAGSGSGGGDGSGMGIGGGVIQQMWQNHLFMDRNVSYTMNGTIIAITTSEDPTVAALLQTHVAMMQDRVAKGQQARRWDPFFVAWFERYDEFNVTVSNVTQGVQVEMEASTDCGQALLDGHTAVVTLFVETGLEEGSQAHAVPEVCLEDDDIEEDAIQVDVDEPED